MAMVVQEIMKKPMHSYCGSTALLHSSTPPCIYGSEKLDFSVAEGLNQEFLATHSNEKQELKELNDRFTRLIEKVLYLEMQNAALPDKLSQACTKEPIRTVDLCQGKLCELCVQLEALGRDCDRLEVDRDNLAKDLALLKQRGAQGTGCAQDWGFCIYCFNVWTLRCKNGEEDLMGWGGTLETVAGMNHQAEPTLVSEVNFKRSMEDNE
uniref:Uncharacterized protein n=1 Tax=Sphaerodactylus townsendi TaxID=933632 RepID=A0ACB8G9J7_9SAUR